MRDTDDWWERLDQADKRLREINTIIRGFIASNPYGIVQHVYPKGKREAIVTATMTVNQPVPRNVSLLLAEIFLHLRSSLDHLMNAVCVTNSATGEAPSSTQFPIFKERTRFFGKNKKGDPAHGSGLYQMRGAPLPVQAILPWLQPYRRRKDPERHELWLIHRFSNIDKHAVPHVTGAILDATAFRINFATGVNIGINHIGVPDLGAFNAGTEIGRLRIETIEGMKPVVDMQTNVTYGVAFDPKGPGLGQPVVPTMRRLIDHLRIIVIPKLEPFV